MTEELAKGNLSIPIKAEKSKYFGRFLWSMDMLRDTLESNREKELELQKEKKTLILSLTHDIKTPLSAIHLYTKALAAGLYSTEERRLEVYRGIEKNVKDMEDYVNEITSASREDFLHLTVNQTEVYLADVMEEVRKLYDDKLGRLHTLFDGSHAEPFGKCNKIRGWTKNYDIFFRRRGLSADYRKKFRLQLKKGRTCESI